MLSVDNIFSLPYSTLYLLPHSPNTILNNRQQKLQLLHLVKSIFNFSIIALDAFKQGQIFSFDAQVGENMCEIRAHKNFTLANKILNSTNKNSALRIHLSTFIEHKSHLELLIAEWENKIIQTGSHNKDLDGNETLQAFLDRTKVVFQLDEDSVYIVTCYFLSYFCVRENDLPVSINYGFIKRELNVSKYQAKRFAQKYQIIVSKLGINFVLSIIKRTCEFSQYLELFPLVNKVSDDNRVVLPCLFTSEILLKNSFIEKRPILIIVRRQSRQDGIIDIICAPVIHDNEHNFITLAMPIDSKKLFIVMLGDVIYENESNNESWREYSTRLVNSFSIYLLANMASHPQYAGSRLHHLKDDPLLECALIEPINLIADYRKKIFFLREQANILGCNEKFSQTILLRHIYASTFIKEISKVKHKYHCAFNIFQN